MPDNTPNGDEAKVLSKILEHCTSDTKEFKYLLKIYYDHQKEFHELKGLIQQPSGRRLAP